MTATPQSKRGKDKPSAAGGAEAPKAQGAAQPAVQPLKPRPRLFAALSAAFAAWVIFLVTLYFTTVPPRRSTVPGYDAQGRIESSDAPAPADR